MMDPGEGAFPLLTQLPEAQLPVAAASEPSAATTVDLDLTSQAPSGGAAAKKAKKAKTAKTPDERQRAPKQLPLGSLLELLRSAMAVKYYLREFAKKYYEAWRRGDVKLPAGAPSPPKLVSDYDNMLAENLNEDDDFLKGAGVTEAKASWIAGKLNGSLELRQAQWKKNGNNKPPVVTGAGDEIENQRALDNELDQYIEKQKEAQKLYGEAVGDAPKPSKSKSKGKSAVEKRAQGAMEDAALRQVRSDKVDNELAVLQEQLTGREWEEYRLKLGTDRKLAVIASFQHKDGDLTQEQLGKKEQIEDDFDARYHLNSRVRMQYLDHGVRLDDLTAVCAQNGEDYVTISGQAKVKSTSAGANQQIAGMLKDMAENEKLAREQAEKDREQDAAQAEKDRAYQREKDEKDRELKAKELDLRARELAMQQQQQQNQHAMLMALLQAKQRE